MALKAGLGFELASPALAAKRPVRACRRDDQHCEDVEGRGSAKNGEAPETAQGDHPGELPTYVAPTCEITRASGPPGAGVHQADRVSLVPTKIKSEKPVLTGFSDLPGRPQQSDKERLTPPVASPPTVTPDVAPRRVPKSVRACWRNPTSPKTLTKFSWPLEAPSKKKRGPFHCNSFRCLGEGKDNCAYATVNPVLYARMKQAFDQPVAHPSKPIPIGELVTFVLTLDRNGSVTDDRSWTDVDDAYRAMGNCCTAFLERLRYDAQKHKEQPITNGWICVVEQHKSGWPHLNVIVHAPGLAKRLHRLREDLITTNAVSVDAD